MDVGSQNYGPLALLLHPQSHAGITGKKATPTKRPMSSRTPAYQEMMQMQAGLRWGLEGLEFKYWAQVDMELSAFNMLA